VAGISHKVEAPELQDSRSSRSDQSLATESLRDSRRPGLSPVGLHHRTQFRPDAGRFLDPTTRS
jgi:hypothetical protein